MSDTKAPILRSNVFACQRFHVDPNADLPLEERWVLHIELVGHSVEADFRMENGLPPIHPGLEKARIGSLALCTDDSSVWFKSADPEEEGVAWVEVEMGAGEEEIETVIFDSI